MRGNAREADARVEGDRAGVAAVGREVESRHAPCAERVDERIDEATPEALPLQLGQQVDVEVRRVGVAEGLGAGRLPGEAQIAAEKLDSDDDVTDETTTD